MSTRSSPERLERTSPELPFRAAWLIAFAAFVLVQGRYWSIPAYHDGILHWDVARAMHRAPWYPFVGANDTGHPPLVSWILGLLWWLPLPRIMSFHLLSWAAAATLVSSTFEIGRRHFGLGVGLSAALLTAFHPVVAAQALQLNLDLFVAAFTLVAVLGATSRSTVMTTVGCVGATFSKLNGIFLLLPIALWLLLEWARQPQRTARTLLSAVFPVALTTVLFAAYHAAKVVATGHLFVTPESVEANLTFVSSTGEYIERLEHGWRQVFGFNNPNRFVAYTLVLSLLVMVLGGKRPGARDTSFGIAALLIGLFVTQLGLWSLRRYPALVRYFLVVYPALYLVALAALSHALRGFARAGLAAVTLSLALAFIAAWNSAYRRALPAALADSLALPPASVNTNHENSLDLIDQLETFRQAVGHLAELQGSSKGGLSVTVAWPYDDFLVSPEHHVTAQPFRVLPWATVSGPAPEPDFALLTSSRDSTRSPSSAIIPGGYRVESAFARGRAWTLLLEKVSASGE